MWVRTGGSVTGGSEPAASVAGESEPAARRPIKLGDAGVRAHFGPVSHTGEMMPAAPWAEIGGPAEGLKDCIKLEACSGIEENVNTVITFGAIRMGLDRLFWAEYP